MAEISVIIPVFNVEHYLIDCVDSVRKQTFKDLQIILIDDGSTDSSGEICDELKTLDNRIEVVHKMNKGVSSARNTGLSLAKGKYISFVDADDWISPEMYEIMLLELKKNEADIVACKFMEETSPQKKNNSNILYNTEIIQSNSIERFLCKDLYGNSICNKLFKNKKNMPRFNENRRVGEDFLFLYQMVKKSNVIIKIDKVGYHYRIRLGSCSKTSFNNSMFDIIISSKEILDEMKCNKDKCNNESTYAQAFLFDNCFMVLNAIIYNDVEKEYEKELKILNDHLIRLWKEKETRKLITSKKRYGYVMNLYFPHIYKVFVKVYYKNKTIDFMC